jgi:hypothetical protein
VIYFGQKNHQQNRDVFNSYKESQHQLFKVEMHLTIVLESLQVNMVFSLIQETHAKQADLYMSTLKWLDSTPVLDTLW